MRQLRQRIPGVFHMQFLSREEVYSYIRYRLAVAGLTNGHLIFSDSAVDAIHHFSSGIPRLINMLCDRVLLRGYLQKTHVVEKELVEASILELSYQLGGNAGERSQSS
jgi:general secretion pathway protein A